jgi:ABC-type uncharacterized transport system permease subunit
VSFGALGAAEYYKLSPLFWFSVVVSVIMVVWVAVTVLAYTINYWNDKNKNGTESSACQPVW